MKQLLVLSGKGGTGKTTIAGAFIKLAAATAYADCDVDAPNLHLLQGQVNSPQCADFFGMNKAKIDNELCVRCDICRLKCRFSAITPGSGYRVDPFACEGCGVCETVCPVGAVSLEPVMAGKLMLYSGEAVFSTARLQTGNGTTGLLVTEVKKRMTEAAQGCDIAIIDGSPGIGCPVIASLSGVDMALIVAEPSLSGISDMERIVATARQFQTKMAVCVNKYDTNLAITDQIVTFCEEQQLPFVGVIPFDRKVVETVNLGRSIVELECSAGKAVRETFKQTIALLQLVPRAN